MRKPRLPPNIALLQRGSKSPSHPEPGFFVLRLVKHGPKMPARIWWCDHEPGNPENILDGRSYLVASIGDDDADPLYVWERGNATTKEQYDFMIAERRWARKHAPSDPVATPYDPVDLSRQPSLF